MTETELPEQAILVYDGECPLCSAFVRMLRLRESVALELVDARAGGAWVDEIVASGFNLDEGMVLRMGGEHYHGEACIHVLALLSTSSGLFNKLNASVFRHRLLALSGSSGESP
jgi:predicted DCC family thiol-disulfide oxidoreductase YuxK